MTQTISRAVVGSAALIAILIGFVLPVPGVVLEAQEGESAQRYAPGRVIVKLRAEAAAPEGVPAQALRQGRRLRSGEVRARLRGRARVEGVRPLFRAPAWRAAPQGAEQGLQSAPGLSRIFVLELEEGEDVEDAVRELSKDVAVEYAQPDYIVQPLFTPNDPFFQTAGSWGQSEDDLWGLKLLQVETAWDTTLGDGVVVAVVDTGVDFTHPDIAANAWVNPGEDLDADGVVDPEERNGIDDDGNGFIDDFHGFDFVRSIDANGDGDYVDAGDVNEAEPIDADGHGTHVAGTVAAVADNGLGVVGVAPEVRLMALRGLAFNMGLTSDLAAALQYAADQGAQVINNSWGCGTPCPSNPVIEDAVRYAHSLDAVVVFAAGNSAATANLFSPQNMSETVTVSALTPADEATFFTNFGPMLDVGAPGGGLISGPGIEPFRNVLSLSVPGSLIELNLPHTIVAPGYARNAGTSMAAPHVTGVAALVRAAQPGLSNEQVRQVLRLSGDPIPPQSAVLGYSRVNAGAAVASGVTAAVLLDTPEDREPTGILALTGKALGPGLQSVQVSIGFGEDPASFAPLPTTWDPVSGGVTASLDTDLEPHGPALLRLSASDGTDVFESTTRIDVDHIRFTSHVDLDVVQGAISIEFEVDTPFAERVVLKLVDQLGNTTQTLVDVTNPTQTLFSVPLDTTAYRDSFSSQGRFLGLELVLEVTEDVGQGPVVTTETLRLAVENATITAPDRSAIFTDTSPFGVSGSSALPYRLEVGQGQSWATVQTGPAGSFSASLDPANAAYGLDLAASNLVLLRLLNDVDGDGNLEELNEITSVLVDPLMRSGWPQRTTEIAGGPDLVMGDVDGDGGDEIVAIAGDLSVFPPQSDFVRAWDGDGTPLPGLSLGAVLSPYHFVPGTLVDLDGMPGQELLYASRGKLHAFRADGQAPAGWAPDTYNDDQFDLLRHLDPSYRELHVEESVVPFRDSSGILRLISGFRHFDVESYLTAQEPQVDASSVALFDAGAALVAEQDQGPSRGLYGVRDVEHNPTLGDFDADGRLEIAVYREPVSETTGVGAQIRILDAETLTLESVIDRPAIRFGTPTSYMTAGAADLDGDGDLELVSQGSQGSVYAFHHDGTDVAGFPYAYGPQPQYVPYVRQLALGDLDLDGDAEIVVLVTALDAFYPEHRVEALDYDPVSQSVSVMWSHPIVAGFESTGLAIGNVDADPEPEVIYNAMDMNLGTGLPTSAVPIPLQMTRHPFVEVLNADGSPWKGGWRRYVRGLAGAPVLGNLDPDGPPDLVVGYSIGYFQGLAAPTNPDLDLRAEVVAYPMEGQHNPAAIPWGQYKGNAQHTASVPDTDLDGVPDQIDNCLSVPNGPAQAPNNQCDRDGDGFGNACDGDFDQNGTTDDDDFYNHLLPDYLSKVDSGVGTDMDCSGTVNSIDFNSYFVTPWLQGSPPGPSGLSCADPTGAGFPCVAVQGPGDTDRDGVANTNDSCVIVRNGPNQAPNDQSCDTDNDGYGNACDGDFDQNGVVDSTDLDDIFLLDYLTGVDSGVGTDMNCDGSVDSIDLNTYFLPQFETLGAPGPSGLP